jgi:hypothetical protein
LFVFVGVLTMTTRNYFSITIVLCLLGISLSGCSVYMALSGGGEEPDWQVLQKGAPRDAVEQELGRPISDIRRSWGDEATYQFVTNFEPSYLRATGYVLVDIVTGGLAEIFTTPAESINALQGNMNKVVVTYDIHGYVHNYRKESQRGPLPTVREALGFEPKGAGDLDDLGPLPEQAPVVLERGQYSDARRD